MKKSLIARPPEGSCLHFCVHCVAGSSCWLQDYHNGGRLARCVLLVRTKSVTMLLMMVADQMLMCTSTYTHNSDDYAADDDYRLNVNMDINIHM